MTPEYTNQLAAQLLLSGLAAVMCLGVASWLYFLNYRPRPTRGNPALPGETGYRTEQADAPAYEPTIFEQSCRWVAVRSSHPKAVHAALGLHNATPCSWGDGLSRLTPRRLFVSPPVRGWILVIGQGLPDPSEDADRSFHFLRRLSRELGQVQFFSANRALNHHAWVRADRGSICRAYAWAGDTLWNQGELTQAETELGMKCLPYGERPGVELGGAESLGNNAEKVVALAARWSFDPTAVSAAMLREAWGVAGDLAQPWRR